MGESEMSDSSANLVSEASSVAEQQPQEAGSSWGTLLLASAGVVGLLVLALLIFNSSTSEAPKERAAMSEAYLSPAADIKVKPTTLKTSTVKTSRLTSTTLESSTLKTSTLKPTASKPTTLKTSTLKPTASKSTTVKTSTLKPTTSKSSTLKTSTLTSTTLKSSTLKTSTLRPAVLTTKYVDPELNETLTFVENVTSYLRVKVEKKQKIENCDEYYYCEAHRYQILSESIRTLGNGLEFIIQFKPLYCQCCFQPDRNYPRSMAVYFGSSARGEKVRVTLIRSGDPPVLEMKHMLLDRGRINFYGTTTGCNYTCPERSVRVRNGTCHEMGTTGLIEHLSQDAGKLDHITKSKVFKMGPKFDVPASSGPYKVTCNSAHLKVFTDIVPKLLSKPLKANWELTCDRLFKCFDNKVNFVEGSVKGAKDGFAFTVKIEHMTCTCCDANHASLRRWPTGSLEGTQVHVEIAKMGYPPRIESDLYVISNGTSKFIEYKHDQSTDTADHTRRRIEDHSCFATAIESYIDVLDKQFRDTPRLLDSSCFSTFKVHSAA